jgi:CarD family transcriptional regulator
MTAKKKSSKLDFKASEFVVYPSHGVGRIVSIEDEEIAGAKLELYVIVFEKEKMTLRVPTAKSKTVGMRKLAGDDVIEKALKTLKGRARVKRTMWSRRAQEYEAKINSGDLIAISEVVRDLFRSDRQPEQSYSERQLYEAALDRMAREIAAVRKTDDAAAVSEIEAILDKGARKLEKDAADKDAAEKDAAAEAAA